MPNGVYVLYTYDYIHYIHTVVDQLLVLNPIYLLVGVNIVGVYLLLKNVTIDIDIRWSVKYNRPA